MSRSIALAAAGIACLVLATEGAAQTTTSNGLFGSRTLGGSFQSRSGGFAGSTGGGQRGIGAGGTAPDASGANAGMLSGNERFVRGNRQPGEFVGSDAGDVQNPMSQLGAQGGTSPLAGLGRLLQATQPSINNAKSPVRPVYSVGFPVPRTDSQLLAAETTARIARRLDVMPNVPLRVEIANRVATLTGSVATAHDRRLAGILVGLEPGVGRVENRLTVDDATTPAPTPPLPESTPRPAPQP